MSVLIEFAMFPTDKGESVSPYVGRILKVIEKTGFKYQLTAMCTNIETETVEQALGVLQQCYDALKPDCNRVYTTMAMDVRQDHANCMENKVKAARSHMNDEEGC